MHHFFVSKEDFSGDSIFLTDENYNHAVNVLRLREGERILISDPDGVDYMCSVAEICRGGGDTANARYPEPCTAFGDAWLRAVIGEECTENHELPAEVVLFQCLPKADKMELIIQKAVELGVTAIVPVQSKNCVVKLDDKKTDAKIRRWQAIAESAAKQSKRSVIPVVHAPVNWKEALEMSTGFNVRMIPYEEENGLTSMCEAIISLLPGRRIAVYIGPEGGFDPMEVSMARRHGVVPVSLGRRILRTETAAIAVLSMIMIRLEIAADQDIMLEEEQDQ